MRNRIISTLLNEWPYVIILLISSFNFALAEFKSDEDANKKDYVSSQSHSIIQEKVNLRKQAQKALFELEVIEGWVNPNEYKLGPGDIVAINIVGGNNLYLELVVNPEGILNIPGYSSLLVRDKTLNELKNLVLSQIGQNAYVSLVSVRPIKIFIAGEVDFPGAYITRPTERLFSVLERAGNFKDLAIIEKIKIYRGRDTLLINGNDFLKRGDLNANPYVEEGDIIYIPKAEPINAAVTVDGAVKRAGLYPIIKNESLYNFLIEKLDFGEKVELNLIKLVRDEQGRNKTFTFDLKKPDAIKQLQNFILHPGDIIEIDLLGDVYVQGEVRNPGAFPFVAGFKVGDYIGLAGGNKTTAALDRIEVVSSTGVRKAGINDNVERGESIIVPKSTVAKVIGEQSILQILSSLIQILLTIQLIQRS